MSEIENVTVSVWVTPIVSISRKQKLYSLPDLAYGEWLIFCGGNPVYYFNFFDSYYDSVRERIGQNLGENLECILVESFVANDLNCKTNVKKPFFSLKRKEYSISIELMKYPVEYFSFLSLDK